MPALRKDARSGGGSPGGIVGYPLNRVYQEIAFLGRNVHWTLDELLTLDHAERRRWVRETGTAVKT
ncbi:DUF6760 family protein [Amycolatopsis sp. RTGN1]|uniref:DUF6760 family protein n=1 Tax=Amycolatopsis ponsaeliensis TaxID=2992142 RepID=UPI003307392D